MDDLLGLGRSTDKLISAVERALGAIYSPYGIRRNADAEAYRLTELEAAKTDAQSRSTVELAKAKTEADIILAEGKQELEARLQARLQHEALRQQQNIEQIVAGALAQPQRESSAEDVDDDWLTSFFARAQSVSGVEMQALWSKVLALEVGTPGTFSPRSLDVLRKMSRQEATAFQAACRLACKLPSEPHRITVLHGAIRQSRFSDSETPDVELGKFGFPFLDRVHLAQIGLMYENGLVLGPVPLGEELTLKFAFTQLKLRVKRGGVKLQNYALTPIGSELSVLVAPEEDSAYIAALCASLSKFFHI